MARVLGGIGASHAPSMEHVYDRGETGTDEWQPLFGPFGEVRDWLERIRPDVLFVIYNDHFDHFWLDAWPQYAIGVADEFPIADEGQGARDFPPIEGHPDLAWHILRGLVADEFDIAVCQEMEVDHGVISPLPMIDFSQGEGWHVPIIPFVSNVILHPLPLPRRFWKLGQALRRAILSYPEDLGVVVVGTGGLSHQLTGPSFGSIKQDFDRQFLVDIAENPERITEYTYEDLMKLGGTEAVEVVQWLIMRGALPPGARPHIEAYYPHRIMGYGLQAYDATGAPAEVSR